jgi:hypothetical protein
MNNDVYYTRKLSMLNNRCPGAKNLHSINTTLYKLLVLET